MKLTELDPQFIRYEERNEGISHIKPVGGEFGDAYPHTACITVDTLAEAQGIWCLCPGCFAKNGGGMGTHMIEVGFYGRGLLDIQSSHNREGKPSRWNVTGTGFDDLTLTPSIDCECWHGYITNGDAK